MHDTGLADLYINKDPREERIEEAVIKWHVWSLWTTHVVKTPRNDASDAPDAGRSGHVCDLIFLLLHSYLWRHGTNRIPNEYFGQLQEFRRCSASCGSDIAKIGVIASNIFSESAPEIYQWYLYICSDYLLPLLSVISRLPAIIVRLNGCSISTLVSRWPGRD